MKKIIFMTLALAFTTAGIHAQSANSGFTVGQQGPNPTADAQAKDATDKLNSIINLSQDQYNQVYQANKNYFYHIQNAVTGRGAARQEYGRETQIKSALTDDQWQKYQVAKQNGQIQ